jgi:hypothetical protein
MTVKLLVHMLRASSFSDGAIASSAGRSLDFGRRVFEELLVRRREPIGWRRQRPTARRTAPTRAEVAHGDAIWTDTQPWCHE